MLTVAKFLFTAAAVTSAQNVAPAKTIEKNQFDASRQIGACPIHTPFSPASISPVCFTGDLKSTPKWTSLESHSCSESYGSASRESYGTTGESFGSGRGESFGSASRESYGSTGESFGSGRGESFGSASRESYGTTGESFGSGRGESFGSASRELYGTTGESFGSGRGESFGSASRESYGSTGESFGSGRGESYGSNQNVR